MEANNHRIWAEVDLGGIAHNYQTICSHAKAPVLCVVKANAYGHGAVPVAKRLAAAGAPYFAVATVEEAVELRENGIIQPILILGYIDASDMALVARQRITASVYDCETAQLLSRAAVQAGAEIAVHFKLDTGMTRLGFPAWETEQTVQEILDCAAMPGLRPEGIFTHFAAADTLDGTDYTTLQFDRFQTICTRLQAAGLSLPLRHCANSGAIEQYEKMHATMTRAGIILYGYPPDPSLPQPFALQPAMTVKARVAQLREIPPDTAISYGCTYHTDQPTRIAVLTIGYADGYLRTGSGQAYVLLGGKKTPVLGRICMDMCMVRVPDGVSVKRGDEAVVFGAGDWTADDAAAAAGTISYEVLCAVSRRVPRFYTE